MWLKASSIYKLAMCALVLVCASAAHGSDLPSAPKPIPVFSATDWSLAGTVIAERALDFTSTEQCLRRPASQCHEAELPRALVSNKSAFIGFESAAAGLSIFEQYQLTKHGHRKLARTIQFANIGIMGLVITHNYKLAGR